MNDFLVRGLYTDVVDIRRKVFIETAKLILNNDYKDVSKIKLEVLKIPFKIINKENATYRCCVHKERAIVAERVRLALGLPLWEGALKGPVTTGIGTALKHEKIRTEEIVKVIPEACEKCEDNIIRVTDNCKKCLAHPCSLVCPVDAFSFTEEQAVINQENCIKCRRCLNACPYNSIIYQKRPCSAACGVKAIGSDNENRAVINHEKCVNCGMCITACPFGAIAAKSESVQVLISLKEKRPMYAIIAPSFIGQFGPLVTQEQIISGIKKIGFRDVVEVAYGADFTTVTEGKLWYKKIYGQGKKYIGTSCCPAWVDMTKKMFPKLSGNILDSHTPMVATAKYIKDKTPDAVVCFIGPCTAKKSESLRPEVIEYVDFVITFEELAAILIAMDIELAEMDKTELHAHASGSGRNYAVSGGVANAFKEYINKFYPDAEVIIEKRDSLKECAGMLRQAESGSLRANLLEGMACPGGCAGGAGVLAPIKYTSKKIDKFAKESEYYPAAENPEID